MMEELLEKLRSMKLGKLTDDDIDEILDSRDEDCFDMEWCRVYDAVEHLKADAPLTEEQTAAQKEICKQAFFCAEKQRSSELSDYISDDFGLIYDSILTGFQDAWLDKLIAAYRSGRIPGGEL
jgi:hypothetical protein